MQSKSISLCPKKHWIKKVKKFQRKALFLKCQFCDKKSDCLCLKDNCKYKCFCWDCKIKIQFSDQCQNYFILSKNLKENKTKIEKFNKKQKEFLKAQIFNFRKFQGRLLVINKKKPKT